MNTRELRAAVAAARAVLETAETRLSGLRAARRAARAGRADALARGDWAAAVRYEAQIADLDRAIPDAAKDVTLARGDLQARRTDLTMSVGDPFTLQPARHPLALLPVRLETRYAWADPAAPDDPARWSFAAPPRPAAAQPVLLIRVYPDTICEDTHEPGLTVEEELWQREYHTRILAARDRAHFVDAWAQLVARAGIRRGAYLAHTSTAKPAGRRPERWSRATRAAALPERWEAEALLADGTRVTGGSTVVVDPLETGPDPAGWADPAGLAQGPAAPGGPGIRWMTDFRAA